MRTVRIVLVAAVALLTAAAAVAQEKPKKAGKSSKLSPAARAVLRLDRLHNALEGLDLTAEQKEELTKLRGEMGPKAKEVFDKMQGILTEEQKSAGEEAVRAAKEAGKKGRAFFGAVEAALKLTAEQQEKMDQLAPEIAALQKEAMKRIKGVLTPEQRKKVKEKMRPAKKKKEPKQAGKKESE